MALQNKKQFGVWMDSRNATVVGRTNVDNGDFIIMDLFSQAPRRSMQISFHKKSASLQGAF